MKFYHNECAFINDNKAKKTNLRGNCTEKNITWEDDTCLLGQEMHAS
jgi:hypothetical protein